MAIFDIELTVFDYETTGTVRGFKNEPWQIGMVSLKRNRIDEDSLYESLLRIDAGRPFNPHAPGRHAQLRGELSVSPTMNEIWPELEPRLTGRPLVAHNVATEKKFTRQAAPMHRFGPWVDTLRVARKVWPGAPSYALEDLVVSLSLKDRVDGLCAGRGAHDALYDSVASAAILELLLAQPGWERTTLGEFLAM